MKKKSTWRSIAPALLGIVIFLRFAAAEVMVYPSVPGLTTSDQFRLLAGGKEIWVEAYGSEHIAKFACSENTSIEITTPGNGPFVIRPEQYVRGVVIGQNKLQFTMIQPGTVFVETAESELLVIANPIPSKAGLAKTAARVFGPGTHNVGTLKIGSDAIEIQGGAVVRGRIEGSGSARIYGAGTIDGSTTTGGGIPAISLEGGSGGYIDGISVRGAAWWAVVPKKINGFTIKNVTISSCSKDGIDPLSCQNLKILNCTVKTPDDAISVKNFDDVPTKNLLVDGCTLAGTSFGDGFTIGFEVKKNDLGFITVRNCTILQGKGNNAVGGHSGFSIIADGPAPVHDVLFENIIVETDVTRNFEIQVTAGNLYPRFGTGVGRVQNVTLRKITWKASKALILKGYNATHMVENVTFENCTVAGKPLRSTADASFTVNQYVKGLKFLSGTSDAAHQQVLSVSQNVHTGMTLNLADSHKFTHQLFTGAPNVFTVSGRAVSRKKPAIVSQPAIHR